MKSDAQLRSDILAELNWDPAINATDIGVIVKDGVVTLTGHLDSYAHKRAAERAAQRVKGVKALATELAVKLGAGYERCDADIALAAEHALDSNVITVKPKFDAADVANKIHEALARQADREARKIEILVNGAEVTRRGKVHSWAERTAAQGAAWSAPGVATVVKKTTFSWSLESHANDESRRCPRLRTTA